MAISAESLESNVIPTFQEKKEFYNSTPEHRTHVERTLTLMAACERLGVPYQIVKGFPLQINVLPEWSEDLLFLEEAIGDWSPENIDHYGGLSLGETRAAELKEDFGVEAGFIDDYSRDIEGAEDAVYERRVKTLSHEQQERVLSVIMDKSLENRRFRKTDPVQKLMVYSAIASALRLPINTLLGNGDSEPPVDVENIHSFDMFGAFNRYSAGPRARRWARNVGIASSLFGLYLASNVSNSQNDSSQAETLGDLVTPTTNETVEDWTDYNLNVGTLGVNNSGVWENTNALNGILLKDINFTNTEYETLANLFIKDGNLTKEFYKYFFGNGTLHQINDPLAAFRWKAINNAFKDNPDLINSSFTFKLWNSLADKQPDSESRGTPQAYFLEGFEEGFTILSSDTNIFYNPDRLAHPTAWVSEIIKTNKTDKERQLGPQLQWITAESRISTEHLDRNSPYHYIGDTSVTTQQTPYGWGGCRNKTTGELCLLRFGDNEQSEAGKNPDVSVINTGLKLNENDYARMTFHRINESFAWFTAGDAGGILNLTTGEFDLFYNQTEFPKALQTNPGKFNLDSDLVYMLDGRDLVAQSILGGKQVKLARLPGPGKIENQPYSSLDKSGKHISISGEGFEFFGEVNETKLEELVAPTSSKFRTTMENLYNDTTEADVVDASKNSSFAKVRITVSGIDNEFSNTLLAKKFYAVVNNNGTLVNVLLDYNSKTGEAVSDVVELTNPNFDHDEEFVGNETKDDSVYTTLDTKLVQPATVDTVGLQSKTGSVFEKSESVDVPTITDNGTGAETLKNTTEIKTNCPVDAIPEGVEYVEITDDYIVVLSKNFTFKEVPTNEARNREPYVVEIRSVNEKGLIEGRKVRETKIYKGEIDEFDVAIDGKTKEIIGEVRRYNNEGEIVAESNITSELEAKLFEGYQPNPNDNQPDNNVIDEVKESGEESIFTYDNAVLAGMLAAISAGFVVGVPKAVARKKGYEGHYSFLDSLGDIRFGARLWYYNNIKR